MPFIGEFTAVRPPNSGALRKKILGRSSDDEPIEVVLRQTTASQGISRLDDIMVSFPIRRSETADDGTTIISGPNDKTGMTIYVKLSDKAGEVATASMVYVEQSAVDPAFLADPNAC